MGCVSLLLDESLPPQLADCLQGVGLESESVLGIDRRSQSDEELIQYCKDHEKVFITRDKRIYGNKHQRQVLIESGISTVFLLEAQDEPARILRTVTTHYECLREALSTPGQQIYFMRRGSCRTRQEEERRKQRKRRKKGK